MQLCQFSTCISKSDKNNFFFSLRRNAGLLSDIFVRISRILRNVSCFRFKGSLEIFQKECHVSYIIGS